jgi:hypothetical protein
LSPFNFFNPYARALYQKLITKEIDHENKTQDKKNSEGIFLSRNSNTQKIGKEERESLHDLVSGALEINENEERMEKLYFQELSKEKDAIREEHHQQLKKQATEHIDRHYENEEEDVPFSRILEQKRKIEKRAKQAKRKEDEKNIFKEWDFKK